MSSFSYTTICTDRRRCNRARLWHICVLGGKPVRLQKAYRADVRTEFRAQGRQWAERSSPDQAGCSCHLALLCLSSGVCRRRGCPGRLDCDFYDACASWRSLCEWYDCYWVLDRYHCWPCSARIRHATHWREVCYFGSYQFALSVDSGNPC